MIRRMSFGLIFYYSLYSVSAQIFYGQGIRDAFSEFDLLGGAIPIPPETGVTFVEGMDGFPAFFIKADADIKSPHRMVLPEKLLEFAIMAIIRPETRNGGYIFSVVNPLDTVVQLGMHISPAIEDKWNLTLYYTDSSVHSTSQKLISYEMPYAKKWTRIALRVLSNEITIFLNCIEVETVTVKREPLELNFDSASTLYLAQAGPIIKGNFVI
ncbi:Collagen alpha-1(XV) chain [Pseudolycoriella hygida]|uniref:Collagen alpha-1(XV) chain n=1 Tax=Pseudolycoriella hygida TaxID=35572 RepID=A0A9Q0N6I4_9DIPT|nr:Collagen alpha-1(XV) chain [Pseudolycoriella hygida]